MVKNLSCLILALLLCGCSSSPDIVVPSPSFSGGLPVVRGSVVNQAAFAQGGSLILGPFRPGTGAAAGYETDQLSLLMIKGINDALPQAHTPFTLTTDDTGAAYFLDGHIDDYGRKIPGLRLRKDQVYLSIDGNIWLHDSGATIFLFKSSTVIDLKTQNFKTAAYNMGVAIAHFIGSFKGAKP